MKEIKCAYCGKVKKEVCFVIGACRSDDVDWCMHEGTGKMSCDSLECHALGTSEGQARIAAHVASYSVKT